MVANENEIHAILLALKDTELDSILCRMLEESLDSLRIYHAPTPDDALAQLAEGGWRVAFIDHAFASEFNGGDDLELLRKAAAVNGEVPLLFAANDDEIPLTDIRAAGAISLADPRQLTPLHLHRAILDACNRKDIEKKLNSNRATLKRRTDELRRTKKKLAKALQQAEDSERLYRVLAENSPIGIWQMDAEGSTVFMNGMARKLLRRRTRRAAESYSWKRFATASANQDDLLAKMDAWRAKRRRSIEFQAEFGAGDQQSHLSVSLASVEPSNGGNHGILASVVDMTDKKQVESAIRHMAQHDALTGLPNRVLFLDRLAQSLAHARRYQRKVAVMLFDLDHFKDINETLGHPAGDALLNVVRDRLLECARDTDTVARLGGDEFAIIAGDLKEADHCIKLCQRVIVALSEPVDIDGDRVTTGTSVGIAVYPDDTDDREQLVSFADMALYHAKGDGRGIHKFFDANMDEAVRQRKRIENDLRVAILGGQLEVHFQPQLDLKTRRVRGSEALIRWIHPQRGFISPADFIPVAENVGFIGEIGEWVLKTACAQTKAWHDAGHNDLEVAVNISAKQLSGQNLVAVIADILEETGFPADKLELEITESLLMADSKHAIDAMNELGRMGITLAIDDFGTGFSSLAYLKQLPVDTLKIDKSFIRDLHYDADDALIASTVIQLGHSLGMRVVAEGVETAIQEQFLTDEGCDILQGFYYGKAEPPAVFEAEFLRNGNRFRNPKG